MKGRIPATQTLNLVYMCNKYTDFIFKKKQTHLLSALID